jgi:replicative DNA helicase
MMDMEVFGINYSIGKHFEKFLNHVESNRKNSAVKTPWENLNKKLNGGLYPGLYSIGAISSLGKTAFSLQLADFIAESHPVLFFTIEMPRNELMARSISRLAFVDNPRENKSVTTLSVLHGCRDKLKLFAKYTNAYFEKMKLLSIYEGDFNLNIGDIRYGISKFVKETKVKPVVFIDYLQIIEAGKRADDGKELYLNDKQSIDYVTKTLKQISREFDIIMVVISSFNRQSYKSPVSFDCFKESGVIEYTSDVLMGLQLSVLDKGFSKNDKEIDTNLNVAKAKEPREISLVILKQRNGKSFEKQKFNFYPANNFFEETNIF